MARSKCPCCECHEFEAVPVVTKSGQKFCLVQCVACGTVVGVLDDVKVASVVRRAERRLNTLLEKVTGAVVAVRGKEQGEKNERRG